MGETAEAVVERLATTGFRRAVMLARDRRQTKAGVERLWTATLVDRDIPDAWSSGAELTVRCQGWGATQDEAVLDLGRRYDNAYQRWYDEAGPGELGEGEGLIGSSGVLGSSGHGAVLGRAAFDLELSFTHERHSAFTYRLDTRDPAVLAELEALRSGLDGDPHAAHDWSVGLAGLRGPAVLALLAAWATDHRQLIEREERCSMDAVGDELVRWVSVARVPDPIGGP